MERAESAVLAPIEQSSLARADGRRLPLILSLRPSVTLLGGNMRVYPPRPNQARKGVGSLGCSVSGWRALYQATRFISRGERHESGEVRLDCNRRGDRIDGCSEHCTREGPHCPCHRHRWGLCTLTEAPGGHYMVYDAGVGLRSGSQTLCADRIHGILPPGAAIDALILSHSDQDHIGSVARLLQLRDVHRVARTGHERATEPCPDPCGHLHGRRRRR